MFNFLFGWVFVYMVNKISSYRPGEDMAMFLETGDTDKALIKGIEYFILLLLQFLVADLILAIFTEVVMYYFYNNE